MHDSPDTPTRAGELFDATESSRIIQAMSRMPFAGGGTVPIPPIRDAGGRNRHNVTGEEVVAFLESLADVLSRHAELHTTLVSELSQVQTDIAGFRRIMGTAD